MPPIILASTSIYRQRLMERLGLPFTSVKPEIHEDSLKDPRLSPDDLATYLATAKACSVAQRYPHAVVIGSDQICVCEGRILSKPGTAARAVDQLRLLSGRTHKLITAVAIAHGDRVVAHRELVSLTMRQLDRAALNRYVSADQPLDCAGSYKLEARGITLFSRIDADDHDSIIGLPLLWVIDRLADLGFQIP